MITIDISVIIIIGLICIIIGLVVGVTISRPAMH